MEDATPEIEWEEETATLLRDATVRGLVQGDGTAPRGVQIPESL